jgi:hypothetical protein
MREYAGCSLPEQRYLANGTDWLTSERRIYA